MRSFKGKDNPMYKHGHSKRSGWSSDYIHFMNVKGRCAHKTNKDYKNYGARGITVCDRWLHGEDGLSGFECFQADMGSKPIGMSIDRIDGAKGYSPDNCRWATLEEQANNKRTCHYLTIDGETKTISQWSRISGIGKETIRHRIVMQGMAPKKAVFNKLSWTKRNTSGE